MPLTEEQTRLVKATAPVFKEHGKTITTLFYKRLFQSHPELKNVFNMAHQETGNQQSALANAVFGYAAHIDNLGALSKAVSMIAHKHASLGIAPEQYPIVGENLLASVKEVLGDAVDQATMDAWKVAYQQLADILIGTEGKLARDAAALEGGWAGWRKFVVRKKEKESDEIVSFYLEAEDGKKLPAYKPGQFISIKQFVPELGHEQPRQYSLSSAPNEKYFRVSVKKESAQKDRPAGKMSSHLHTNIKVGMHVEVSHPFGDFHLRDAPTPVVLISGGVGLTPMVAMLEAIVAQNQKRKVVFVHAARDKKVHAMREYLNEVVKKNSEHVSKIVFYGDVNEATQGTDYDLKGRIEINAVKEKVLIPNADFYLCGPVPFMRSMETQLVELGVEKERIHSEAFGVAGEE